MTDSMQFTARLISTSASGYATAAAHRLLEKQPEIANRFGGGAFGAWQVHLKQRIEELSNALLAGDPQLFVAEVAWSAEAFRAREVPDSDLRASLECLREVLLEELPPGSADEPKRYLELGLEGLDGAGETDTPAPSSESESNHLGLVYLEAALSGDRRRAVDAVMTAVDEGFEIGSAFDALLFAQLQVGEMWHAQQLGVAQEHVVTETTRTVMTLLTERAERKEDNGKTVVVALVPGNSHDIGSRIVASYFELEGWRTIHLAEPILASDLILGLEIFEPDVLALSMSLATQLSATMSLVESVRARHPGVKVLVGGRSLAQSPQLCERIGADACGETVDEALRLGARLVGLATDGD